METSIIYPFISPVPSEYEKKKKGLSLFARELLSISAEKSGLKLGNLNKNDNGAPIPDKGIYWSISHKNSFAAAVCALYPIGIDIEYITPRTTALFSRIADKEEWGIFKDISWDNFYKIFTAKEAVLKMKGEGLKGLKKSRVQEILDDTHIMMQYEKEEILVESYVACRHIAAVTIPDNCTVQWGSL